MASSKQQGPTKESLESSDDPARSFITARMVDHPATASKSAHSTLMWTCIFCRTELAWSSWFRVRGHLCGDSILALANGAMACASASSDVKLMFKGILTASLQKKKRNPELEARPRRRRKGRRSRQQQQQRREQQQRQRIRMQATALAPARIRGVLV
jgi:hypothetical protein